MPYISDVGLVRNFTKAEFNTTSEMPSLEMLRTGYNPGHGLAPPGVGSVVSQFRRVHNNILIANYASLSSVTLDDAGSRMLMCALDPMLAQQFVVLSGMLQALSHGCWMEQV
eukprot:SAG11_NODE_1644_length_4526_cov_1.563813_2_plen_112_part_00